MALCWWCVKWSKCSSLDQATMIGCISIFFVHLRRCANIITIHYSLVSHSLFRLRNIHIHHRTRQRQKNRSSGWMTHENAYSSVLPSARFFYSVCWNESVKWAYDFDQFLLNAIRINSLTWHICIRFFVSKIHLKCVQHKEKRMPSNDNKTHCARPPRMLKMLMWN